MCGRFALFMSLEEILKRYALDPDYHQNLFKEFSPSYNISPGQDVLAVIAAKGKKRAGLIHWGIKPSWMVKKKQAVKPFINARVEGVRSKPSFAPLFKSRRCLIPANGFFEWQRGPNGDKLPYYFFLTDGADQNRSFSMAGLWERWEEKDGRKRSGMLVITQPSDGKVSKVHHRMPLILPSSWDDAWLSNVDVNLDELTSQSKEMVHDQINCLQVNRAVNKTGNDYPELIAPED